MWTRIDAATRDLPAPLAAVDLQALDANADALARRARGVPIRIATKSVRCREVLRRTVRRVQLLALHRVRQGFVEERTATP